ncbi:MAG: hypothetical protein WCC63_03380 [Candidatus Bathyarchaeia archaeon]
MTVKREFCRCLLVGLMLFSLLLSFHISTLGVRGSETHDIAVTSVVKDRSGIAPAMRVKINVTVENQGNTIESFTVTVYGTNIITNANTTIQSAPVDLEAGQNETLAFVWEIPPPEWPIIIFSTPLWDTNPMVADFTIWAEASVVDGEIDTSNNVYVDGTVRIILRFGDVDGNGVINIFDIVKLAAGYGSKPGDPGYNPLMDYDQNGVIEIFDVVRTASAYGTLYF